MRTMTGIALLALVTTFSLGAAAVEPAAGPPKPGKKCSVSAEAVGASPLGSSGWGVGLVAGAALVAAARRGRRAP